MRIVLHKEKRVFCFAVILILISALLAPIIVYADEDASIFSTRYELLRDNVKLSRIEKNEKADIVITVKTKGLDGIDASALSLSNPQGHFSFTDTAKSIEGSDNEYTVTYTNIQYSGSGYEFHFTIGHPKLADGDISLTIRECRESGGGNSGSSGSSSSSYRGDDVVIDRKTPNITITNVTYPKDLKAGDKFRLGVTFKATIASPKIENATVSFDTSEGLISLNTSSSKFLDAVASSKTQTVYFDLQVLSDAASAGQSVALTFNYEYVDNQKRSQATTNEKVSIPITPKEKEDEDKKKDEKSTPTPNIIISGYNYGGSVPAGSTFTVDLEFLNTSELVSIENLVMNLSPSEGLALQSSTNTFYIKSLPAGTTITQSVQLKASHSIKETAGSLGIAFKYEYMDYDKNIQSVTSEEKVAINVYQPDRFTLSYPQIPEEIYAGEDFNISIPYVNKGKTELFNVTAELVGDVPCSERIQNLGNFEPGKSGEIEFYITPEEMGELDVQVVISYEDDEMNVKQNVIPVRVSVNEGERWYYEEPFDMEMGEESSNGILKWILIAGCAVVLVTGGITALIIRKKRKQKKFLEQLELADLEEDD